MKEDFVGFLGDEGVTNIVIDTDNYIFREEESNSDNQNFYVSIILFVSSNQIITL